MAQITQVGPELWVVPTGHFRTEWRVPPRYTPQTVLGTGVYGTVIKAFDNQALKHVAIKRIAKAKLCMNDSEALRALREIAVLRRLRHPNIVALLDAFEPVVGDDGLIQALYAKYSDSFMRASAIT
jgi:serine/threonine protein kinase